MIYTCNECGKWWPEGKEIVALWHHVEQKHQITRTNDPMQWAEQMEALKQRER